MQKFNAFLVGLAVIAICAVFSSSAVFAGGHSWNPWNNGSAAFSGNAIQNTYTGAEDGWLVFDSDNYYVFGSGSQAFANQETEAAYSGSGNGAGEADVLGASMSIADNVRGVNVAAAVTAGMGRAVATGRNVDASVVGSGDVGTFSASKGCWSPIIAFASTQGGYAFEANGSNVAGAGITAGFSATKVTPNASIAISAQSTSSFADASGR